MIDFSSRAYDEDCIVTAGIPIYTGVVSLHQAIHITRLPAWCYESRYVDRIKTSKGKHLRGSFSPTMNDFNLVYVAETGMTYKLDSHSRSEAIKDGYLTEYPEHVFYKLHRVATMKQAEDLFFCFDSKESVDTTGMIVQYIMRSLGLELRSPLLKKYVLTSLKLSDGHGNAGGTPTITAIESLLIKYTPALKLLDVIEISGKPLCKKQHGRRELNSVIIAALLTILKEKGNNGFAIVANYLNRSLQVDTRISPIYDYIDSNKPITDSHTIKKGLYKEWLGRLNAYADGKEYND